MQQLIMSDIDDLSDSNRILKDEIADLTNNKNSIELYAREKYGYIKKRESFVQIIKNEQK
jgi:Septum formation initiator|tara:strand:+ start:190 stop:369 length:180 start_codon:yes stop_codon:yes gene_type:complete